MTSQVDVGFSAIPFFLDKVDAGEIRIIATGNDVAALKTRTGRVNITNVQTLQNRRDALVRFNRGYRETIDWLYNDPAAIKVFSDYSGLPEKVAQRVPQLFPRETLVPDKVVGIDQIMAEAMATKFISAPLSAQQVSELIQIPEAK